MIRRLANLRRFLAAVFTSNFTRCALLLTSLRAVAAADRGVVIPPTASPTNGATTADLDIRPIKDAIPLPDYWLWLWAALGILAAAALAWWLWKWFHKRAVRLPESVLIPPHRRAIERLKGAFGLIEEPEPFCTEVSQIVRHYLEERFSLRAPERTTEEFLSELSRSPALDLRHKNLLSEFLTSCDLVKFARHEPARPELEALFQHAMRLVEETSPIAPLGAEPPPTPQEARP